MIPNPFNYQPMYDGYDVYHWPEFQALIKRLGVAEPFLTRGLTIRVAEGEVVEVTHTYVAVDTTRPRASIDTTTVHNKEFRTQVPCADYHNGSGEDAAGPG